MLVRPGSAPVAKAESVAPSLESPISLGGAAARCRLTGGLVGPSALGDALGKRRVVLGPELVAEAERRLGHLGGGLLDLQ